MRRLLSVAGALSLLAGGPVLPQLFIPVPAQAQSNNDDFTPLNSRIRRNRQFPTSLAPRFDRERTKVNQERGRTMLGQLSRCVYNRSRKDSLDLLERTDFGFFAFEQIGLTTDRALRIYGFRDCMNRVASMNNSGVALRFIPGDLRQWLIQAAYFDRYPDGPEWVVPASQIGAREFPLSEDNVPVQMAVDIGDCVVAADPYAADYFFRTSVQSAEEREAIQQLVPLLGPCIPEGQQIEFAPYTVRIMLGEALWHASRNISPAPADAEGAQGEP